MKRFFISLAIAVFAAACSETDTEYSPREHNTQQVSIGATIDSRYDGTNDTRATIDKTDGKASWQNGDRIGVSVASDPSMQTYELSTSDCKMFCGEIAAPSYATGDRLYAAYPADALGSGNHTASFRIESSQDGTLPEPMMTASSAVAAGSGPSNLSLHFRQAGAVLILNTDSQVDLITINAIGGEDIAGTYTYDFNSDAFSCSGAKSIEVTPASQTVFIHMPAIELSKGICLTLTRGTEKMIQSVGSMTLLEAGKAYSLGSLVFCPASVQLGEVKTSYTTDGTVAKTNDIDGSEMRFGTCTFSGISNTMVAETGIEYDGTHIAADRSGKNFTPATLTGLEWKQYTIRAYVKTLDGNIFYSASKDATVTGIPYSAAPPKSDRWTASNTANVHFRDSYVQLGMDGTSTNDPQITLTFNIPETINTVVDVSVNVNSNKAVIWYNPTFTLTVGGNTLFTQQSNKDSKTYNISKNAVLSSGNSSIECKTGVRTRLGGQAQVHSVSVRYQ